MKRLNSFLEDQDTPDDSLINLTPLIDVVFVVLIMFILIAPLVELDRIELASRNQENALKAPRVESNAAVKIQVFDNNTIWVNNRLVKENTLGKILHTLYIQNPQTIPQLYHDKKAHFGTYQTVKNALETSGYEQMDVILNPD
ncbi:MAG: biopolymer transporter ExbD [Simkaniaceae bacterium]|nr:biopolymer transporter ExbD [Simkaniaceae bacterium]